MNEDGGTCSESGAKLEVNFMVLGPWIGVGQKWVRDKQGDKESRVTLGFLPGTLGGWCGIFTEKRDQRGSGAELGDIRN